MVAQRLKIYGLGALLAILAFVAYSNFFNRGDVSGIPSVTAADTEFVPLDVQEPHLRFDLLAKIQKSEYSGSHRNVFVEGPPPRPVEQQKAAPQFVGPRMPPPTPPPPPLQVPGEFFGYASAPGSARRVAFYKNGDDVQLVDQGDIFLGSFRLVHIGDDSVDVEDVATGRRVTIRMVQPAGGQAQ